MIKIFCFDLLVTIAFRRGNSNGLFLNQDSKEWWVTVNRITSRKMQGTFVSLVISPEVINTYFQIINYEASMHLQITVGTRLPTVNESKVRNLVAHQKQTALGPDEFPYWLWHHCSQHLAPVITRIFNCSL